MLENHNLYKLAIIIPNWNGLAHLTYSLPSLLNALPEDMAIAMIDDRSSDESVEYVEATFPRITCLRNQRSQGFAGSVNTGLEWAIKQIKADFIVIANNDIQLADDSLCKIRLFLCTNKLESLGLLGFHECNPPSTLKDVTEAIPSQGLGSLKDVERIPGCFFLISRRAFERVGFLDESYYMYGEDNDYFFRIINCGMKIVQSDFPIWHRGEGSSRGSLKTSWLAYRNALRFTLKNHPPFLVFRTILSLANQAANPFLKRSDPSYRRLSRHSIPTNALLLFGGLCWNLWYFGETIRLRRNVFKEQVGERSF
jgi:GT2 family glycosyltransferase